MNCIADLRNEAACSAALRWSIGSVEALLASPLNVQALCFYAGANSIFYGDKPLTTRNPDVAADRALFDRLGLHAAGGDA